MAVKLSENIREHPLDGMFSSSRCQLQHEGRGRKEEASAVVGTAVIGEIQAGNDAISMLFAKMYR